MKLSKKILLLTALLSVILFALGLMVYEKLFALFEPQVDGIVFQITEGSGTFKTSLLFSLAAALIPRLTVLTWQLGPIISSTKRFASVVTILIFIVTAIVVRHEEVKTYFNSIAKKLVASNNNMTFTYPIDPVNFVYYMLAGLCIGCIISYFLFKERAL